MQNLPVFVINLDRRTDRWNSITQELAKVSVAATRVSAVDGRSLNAEDIPTAFLSASEYACLLSHYKALRQFLNTDRPAALILEDDAQLAADIPSILECTEWWPPEVRLMNLDHSASKPRYFGQKCGRTPSGRIIRPIAHKYLRAGGYLINRSAATAVLKSSSRIPPMPIDVMLFNLGYSRIARHLKPVQVTPSMVRQKSEYLASDLKHDRKSTHHRGWIRFHHLYMKIPGLPNWIRVLFLWCFGIVQREMTQYRDEI